jgi:hypothetical protein
VNPVTTFDDDVRVVEDGVGAPVALWYAAKRADTVAKPEPVTSRASAAFVAAVVMAASFEVIATSTFE